MKDLFKGLKRDTIRRNSSRSKKWLANKIEKLRDNSKSARPRVGGMYLYVYDAKTKDKLEYWDSNPLIVMIGSVKGGWYGLNLHYLPPRMRTMLINELLSVDARKMSDRNKAVAKSTILARVGKSKFFAATIKRYLTSHVKSKFVEIPQNEWQNVASLPVAKWNKSTAPKVYAASRGKI